MAAASESEDDHLPDAVLDASQNVLNACYTVEASEEG
jgi:hypothetical protein